MKKHYFTTTKNTYYIDGKRDIIDNNGVVCGHTIIKYLYSYDTLIGYVIYDSAIDETHVFLTKYYDYSRTTEQHLHKFLNYLDIRGGFNIPNFRKICEYGAGVKTLITRCSGNDIFYHYDGFNYDMETYYLGSDVKYL